MENEIYLAHITEDGRCQTVEAHLSGTAERAGRFAAAFGEEQRGRLLGEAHDIGKRTKEFQKRLRGGTRVDHATAGALSAPKSESHWQLAVSLGTIVVFRIMEI